MDKLLAMHVAAQLTMAACANEGINLPLSPDLSDPNVRAKNLQVWETFRAFYRGVVNALADTTSWPAPVKGAPTTALGSTIQGLVTSILPMVAPLLTSGPIGAVITKLLAAIPAIGTPSLPTTIPDPGAPTAVSPGAPTAAS